MVQLDRMIAGGVGEERHTPSISRVNVIGVSTSTALPQEGTELFTALYTNSWCF